MGRRVVEISLGVLERMLEKGTPETQPTRSIPGCIIRDVRLDLANQTAQVLVESPLLPGPDMGSFEVTRRMDLIFQIHRSEDVELNGREVWAAGRRMAREAWKLEWELFGIFATREGAIGACVDPERDFIFRVPFGMRAPEAATPLPGFEYPLPTDLGSRTGEATDVPA